MESYKFEDQKKKLQGLCDEHNLVFRLRVDDYPITLTIRPCGGVSEQMSMLDNSEKDGYISPEAFLIFAFKDCEVEHKTSGVFTISDVLFTKIKNIFKKLHYFWLQYFFREIMGAVSVGAIEAKYMPKTEEDTAKKPASDMAGEQIDGLEPLEVDDDVLDGLEDDEPGELPDPEEIGLEGDSLGDVLEEDAYPYERGEADAGTDEA